MDANVENKVENDVNSQNVGKIVPQQLLELHVIFFFFFANLTFKIIH